jgi:protein TonB
MDKKEGIHLSYTEGELSAKENYVNDLREGHSIYYSKINGRTTEGECVLGKNEGLWISYKTSPNSILLKRNFVHGKLDGPFQSYYENGEIKRRDMYVEDSLIRGNCFAIDGTEMPYYDYETNAIYKNGAEDYKKYMTEHFEYPEYCINKNIRGKVYLVFVINAKGEVVNIKVAKGAHPALNKAALNVFKDMPNWTPAKIDGEGVSSYFTQVIRFELD